MIEIEGENVSNIYFEDKQVIKYINTNKLSIYDHLLYEYLIGLYLNHRPNFIQTIKIDITVNQSLIKKGKKKASEIYSLFKRPQRLYLGKFEGIPLKNKIFSMNLFEVKILFCSLITFFCINKDFRHNDIHWQNILVDEKFNFVVIDYARSDIINIFEYDYSNKQDDVVSIIHMLIDCLRCISIFSLKDKLDVIKIKKKIETLQIKTNDRFILLVQLKKIIE